MGHTLHQTYPAHLGQAAADPPHTPSPSEADGVDDEESDVRTPLGSVPASQRTPLTDSQRSDYVAGTPAASGTPVAAPDPGPPHDDPAAPAPGAGADVDDHCPSAASSPGGDCPPTPGGTPSPFLFLCQQGVFQWQCQVLASQVDEQLAAQVQAHEEEQAQAAATTHAEHHVTQDFLPFVMDILLGSSPSLFLHALLMVQAGVGDTALIQTSTAEPVTALMICQSFMNALIAMGLDRPPITAPHEPSLTQRLMDLMSLPGLDDPVIRAALLATLQEQIGAPETAFVTQVLCLNS